MRTKIRTACVGAVIAMSLLLATGAQAKAPPDGVDLCGVSGACVHLTVPDAETNWALWASPNFTDARRASSIAPFLVVRWHWPNEQNQTAYYIPSTGKVRQVGANGLRSWFDLADAQRIRTLTANLDAYPAPVFSSVTVGAKPVADPQSYVKLFAMGREWFPLQYPRFIRIRFASDTPSPWTDNYADVRISRTGRLLWVDGRTFRIPLQLARQIRARRSLGS